MSPWAGYVLPNGRGKEPSIRARKETIFPVAWLCPARLERSERYPFPSPFLHQFALSRQSVSTSLRRHVCHGLPGGEHQRSGDAVNLTGWNWIPFHGPKDDGHGSTIITQGISIVFASAAYFLHHRRMDLIGSVTPGLKPGSSQSFLYPSQSVSFQISNL